MLFWTFDFEEKKSFADFFGANGIPKKFKILKIIEKHYTGELHKKSIILHQAWLTHFFDSPCIHVFLTHPVYMYFDEIKELTRTFISYLYIFTTGEFEDWDVNSEK